MKMETLKALAEDYLKARAMEKIETTGNTDAGWRVFLEGELKKGYGQGHEVELKAEDWGRLISIFQITKQCGRQDEQVREFMNGDPDEGNEIWTTAEIQERKMRDMLGGSKKWLLVVTKNTHTNRKILKRYGQHKFATIKTKMHS